MQQLPTRAIPDSDSGDFLGNLSQIFTQLINRLGNDIPSIAFLYRMRNKGMLTLVEIPGVPENVNLNLYRYSEVERLLTDKAFFIKREMESKLSQLEESA